MRADDYDLGQVVSLAKQLYVPVIYRHFGDPGTEALRKILDFLPKMFGRRDPELVNGDIFVCILLDEAVEVNSVAGLLLKTFDALIDAIKPPCTIQLTFDGTYRVWLAIPDDVVALSKKAVVYQFSGRRDIFIANGDECVVPKILSSLASAFAATRYRSLEDALEEYKVGLIRSSRCEIFQGAWRDPQRLELKPKPEHIMRRSLERFLQIYLGADVEVHPEHIVDESHPVDLRVFWNFARQEVLIEVKWLGISTDGQTRTEYTAARARSGAKQLVEYLDENRVRSGSREVRGMLVVFDARRRFRRGRALSHADAFYYENREISYMPDYAASRSDFDEPRRFFAEPKV